MNHKLNDIDYRKYSSQLRERQKRHRKLITLVLAGLLVLGLVALVILKISNRENQTDRPPESSAQGNGTQGSGTQGGESQGSITRDSTPTPTPTTTQIPTPTPTQIPTPSLEPIVIMLDPGHGGYMQGAYYNNKAEKDLNLKIAGYAKSYLEENYDVFAVYLTREDDNLLDNDRDTDIAKRVEKAVSVNADLYVSLHLNATDTHKKQGAEVVCPHRESVKKDAFRLADCILEELKALGIKSNGQEIVKSKYTFDEAGKPLEGMLVNRYTADVNMIGVIVEHCYMDNESDSVYVQDEEGLRRLGEADARGIAAYFGY